MKATINGIAVEGTPQEIVDYMKLHDDLRRQGTYIKPPLGKMPEWLKNEIEQNKQHGIVYCIGICQT